MTELLYQRDSYVRTWVATVTGVDPVTSTVTLDRTAFYPGGGGQPADTGTMTRPQDGNQPFARTAHTSCTRSIQPPLSRVSVIRSPVSSIGKRATA